VRALWELLRSVGIDAKLDRSFEGEPQDWPLWMLEQFREADFVIVVASGAYRRWADGDRRCRRGSGGAVRGGRTARSGDGGSPGVVEADPHGAAARRHGRQHSAVPRPLQSQGSRDGNVCSKEAGRECPAGPVRNRPNR
jgi:hypothetical protein